MTTITANLSVTSEVHAADRSYKHWIAASCTGVVYIINKGFLICSAWCCTAQVDSVGTCPIAFAQIVSLQGITVDTTVLLVVVGELDKYVVACLKLLLDSRPACCVTVEAFTVGSTLTIIDNGNAVGIEELL